jgi:hypothetical protein
MVIPFAENFSKAKKIKEPIRRGRIDEIETATKNPGGMVAPSAPAIKLQMLFNPAPINPAMAPAFSAFPIVVSVVDMFVEVYS